MLGWIKSRADPNQADPNQAHLRVVLIVGPGEGNHAGADEAAHVVHMAVDDLGVPLHAPPQPDHLLQAQVVLQHLRMRIVHQPVPPKATF